MKKFLFVFLFGFVLSLNAQEFPPGFQQDPTAQRIVPLRVNAEATIEKPYVIFISIDGLRYDYLEKFNANHLLKTAKEGVWADQGMLPVFPSATFPNHYSMATGLYPARHGIVDNSFYDPGRDILFGKSGKFTTDASWFGGVPIWSLAERQGVMSATLFWLGSETNAGGMRPSYYYDYHEKFSIEDRIDIVKTWLTLPDCIRPHLITLYFPEVDHAGHAYGPEAAETIASVCLVNQAINMLQEQLEPLNLPINYILVSDHGMIKVDKEDHLDMLHLDSEKYRYVMGTQARITAIDKADIMPLYKELKKDKTEDYEVFLASEMPAELMYSSREDTLGRIGDIIVIPTGTKYFLRKPGDYRPGKHGYNPEKVPEMKATFMAWGPAFKKGQRIEPFRNIHIYPVIAEILGLEVPADIDGNIEVLGGILKD